MSGNARLADLWSGICCCHAPIPCIPMSGIIVTASPDRSVNNLGQARLSDMTIGFCGCPGVIVSASGDVSCNGRGVARCGDAVAGCNIGTIISCSGDVSTN